MAMFYFVKRLSALRIVTEPCSDRILLFGRFSVLLHLAHSFLVQLAELACCWAISTRCLILRISGITTKVICQVINCLFICILVIIFFDISSKLRFLFDCTSNSYNIISYTHYGLSSHWETSFLLLVIMSLYHIIYFSSGFDLLPIVKPALLLGCEIQEITCRPVWLPVLPEQV